MRCDMGDVFPDCDGEADPEYYQPAVTLDENVAEIGMMKGETIGALNLCARCSRTLEKFRAAVINSPENQAKVLKVLNDINASVKKH